METYPSTIVANVNDPDGRLSSFIRHWKQALQEKGAVVLCLAGTETSDIEGISAAGADGPARRLTPALDAEALVLGKTITAAHLPKSPKGVVSPVVVSRAMVEAIDCDIDVFDCGAFVPPQVNATFVAKTPACRIDAGASLRQGEVDQLFSAGLNAGRNISRDHKYVILAECVPGGTTTALGILTAMGYEQAHAMVSSSLPAADGALRKGLVESGLSRCGCSRADFVEDPLRCVAALGDPMQAFAAGFLLSASESLPVVLGGGTQMLALYALAQDIMKSRRHTATFPSAKPLLERHVAVVTTKWIAHDVNADAARLAQLLGAPLAVSMPDFHSSRHQGLQLYEEGNVKEGVAAGALMAAASLRGIQPQEIMRRIDETYDRFSG